MRRPTRDSALRTEDVIFFAITGKIRVHLVHTDEDLRVGEDFQGGVHIQFRPLNGRKPTGRRAAAASN